MNSKQLQYAITLARTNNYSQASELLNISQSTLSKQILSLEKELGISIFDRNTVPLTVTPAGEHFLREAQALVYREDQLLRSLEQYRSGEKGRLVIGISPFRNLTVMPAVLKKFKKQFPGVQVLLQEAPSDRLREEAADGKYDFAVVNLPVDESLLDITLLKKETLALAVPNTMVDKIPGGEKTKEISFADCQALPFVVVAQGQEMRRYFDNLCAKNNICPEIAVEVFGGVTAAWSMARGGIGATLLPLTLLEETMPDNEMTLFSLKDTAFTRQPAVVYRKGQYLSPAAKYAIALLEEFA